jgi:hypothetical protein
MDCKEFREALDLYLDGELAAEAVAAANAHVSECAPCRKVHQELLRLRRGVQQVVRAHGAPSVLEERIRGRLAPGWQRVWTPAAVLAMVLLALLVAGASPGARGLAARSMEFVAFHMDPPRIVELDGQLVCRDCELEALYGVKTMCHLKGHRTALKTSDGKIWNLMEGEHTESLLHDDSLRSKIVHIRGRLYRRAGCVEVENYRVL